MSKFYRCVTAWTRHSVGEVIPEHEYNKLPQEIKDHKSFELIEDSINITAVTGFGEPIDDSSGNFDIQIQTDILADEKPSTTKYKRYDKTGTSST